MNSELIQEEELFEYSDTRQRKRLLRWMNDNRIPYFLTAKQKIATTTSALNRAMIGDDDRLKIANV